MKKKKIILSVIIYILFLCFISNNAWMYKRPIGKIIHVAEEKKGTVKSVRGGEENYFVQKLKIKILNGKSKGEILVVKNEYTSSRVVGQKYHKFDRVLLNTQNGKPINSIKTLKRDTYLAAFSGLILFLLLYFTGKQGLRTCFTIVVNCAIYATGFYLYMNGQDILKICNVLVLIFVSTTLFLLNGMQKKTLSAVISTFSVLGIIMLIFYATLKYTAAFDYSTMEYLGSIDNPEDLFVAEVMFAGLGAIMDVAVTLSSTMEELIRKKPEITWKELYKSGREVGYDIMGTMISVLLFTFAAGLIPSFLIRMNNDIAFVTNLKLYIPFEISRFLIESIGIVSAIPISIFIGASLFKWEIRKEQKR